MLTPVSGFISSGSHFLLGPKIFFAQQVDLRPRKLGKQSCYRATVPKLQMPLVDLESWGSKAATVLRYPSLRCPC
ncbi:unnamed protein product [Larinioides sclopetarius]|uniref:Uncharacterized protein n=1 Tax=Larinioides sclopetarius TaxID=280406 RepID=A0AAV2AQH5_9ARAC